MCSLVHEWSWPATPCRCSLMDYTSMSQLVVVSFLSRLFRAPSLLKWTLTDEEKSCPHYFPLSSAPLSLLTLFYEHYKAVFHLSFIKIKLCSTQGNPSRPSFIFLLPCCHSSVNCRHHRPSSPPPSCDAFIPHVVFLLPLDQLFYLLPAS